MKAEQEKQHSRSDLSIQKWNCLVSWIQYSLFGTCPFEEGEEGGPAGSESLYLYIN